MLRAIPCLFLILVLPFNISAKDINTQSGPYGGTLVWGSCYPPTIINPILTTHSISMTLQDLIFNKLIRLNSKGELEGDLAEKWEVSEDGLTYTFYLRRGVRFHDGAELSSQDVKFTFDKITDPQTSSPFRSLFDLVKEFRAKDKYVFQVELTKASPSFIYRLIKEIAPRHLLENKDLNKAAFNRSPVGTGPFRFREWSKDGEIILEYNPDYYEGRPYLDRIIVKTYPDSHKLCAAMMRQEADLAFYIDKDDYEMIKKDPSFHAYALAVDTYYAMVYNLEDPILSDIRVRQAIVHAVNRKALIEEVASGYGEESIGPFSFASPAFNRGIKPFEFDPQKAKALLDTAGWRHRDGDGIREKKGIKLELRVLVDSRQPVLKRIAMVLRQQLQSVGLKLTVHLYNDDTELTEDRLQNNAQAQIITLISTREDPGQLLDWSPEEYSETYCLWMYKNPEIARYFSLGRICKSAEKRKRIYQKIHNIIYADQPACFLYFPSSFFASSSRIQNIDELFTHTVPVYTIKNCTIKEGSLSQDRREVRKWR